MVRIQVLLISAIGVTLGGCAGEQAMRETASISAQIVNDLKTETARFITLQNQLNEANVRRLQQLRQAQTALTARSGISVATWQASGDQDAIAMQRALTGPPARDVLASSASLALLRPVTAAQIDPVDAAQFDTLIKTLTALSEEPSAADRAQSFIDFGQALAEEYQSSIANAGSEAANTTTAEIEADEALLNPRDQQTNN
jgi:hypothetical protein